MNGAGSLPGIRFSPSPEFYRLVNEEQAGLVRQETDPFLAEAEVRDRML